MGSFIGKAKQEGMETPSKDSVLKRIEDPRSPTEEINRTPIEVTDKVSKERIRNLAFVNLLKQQNQVLSDSSSLSRKIENCDRDYKPKYPFTEASDNTPILYAEESTNTSFDVSTIEKENVQ